MCEGALYGIWREDVKSKLCGWLVLNNGRVFATADIREALMQVKMQKRDTPMSVKLTVVSVDQDGKAIVV